MALKRMRRGGVPATLVPRIRNLWLGGEGDETGDAMGALRIRGRGIMGRNILKWLCMNGVQSLKE
jgi:hypothetical protein